MPQLLILLKQRQGGDPALLKFLTAYTKLFTSSLDAVSYKTVESDPYLQLYCMGMCGLLKYTTQDIEFACLQTPRSDTPEKMQNVLVNDVSEYLSKI